VAKGEHASPAHRNDSACASGTRASSVSASAGYGIGSACRAHSNSGTRHQRCSSSAQRSETCQQEAAIYLSPPAQPLPTVPSNDVSPPLPAATGAPAPGVVPAIPAGSHLLDGDFVSDRHQLEWGDLRVKISVHGGAITGVQILQYPDHRSHSLDLSEMAGPILESEVIKVQKAQVDAVSSATDTSYAFQDVIADVLIKATRQ
jgi:uncharacterized protein with FMN-binding domain